MRFLLIEAIVRVQMQPLRVTNSSACMGKNFVTLTISWVVLGVSLVASFVVSRGSSHNLLRYFI